MLIVGLNLSGMMLVRSAMRERELLEATGQMKEVQDALLRSQERYIAQDGLRAYLYSLRVMEMFRGLGIGSRLIHEAEAIVTSMSYTWVTIAAAKTNPKARKLYERMGYRVFADDPGEWSYTDHRNIVQYVRDPCWLLEKNLRLR